MAAAEPRVERTLVARCRRCEPDAYEAVGYRYAAPVYEAIASVAPDANQAHILFREAFRRLGDSVHQVRRGRDLNGHVAAIAEQVLADNLAGGRGEPIVIAPANGESGALGRELGGAAAAIMRAAAEARLPSVAVQRRRAAANRLIALATGIIALGVLVMLFHSRLAVLDPRVRAQRAALAFVHDEVVATGLAESLRALADDPLTWDAEDEAGSRHLSELCLALEEIANTDPRTASAQLGYWRPRIEGGDLARHAADLAERYTGQEREDLLRAGLVLEEISNL